MGGLLALLAILVFIFFWVYLYNRLIILRNQVENAWYQIDVQLKRRYNLIPNLVETVRGYAVHERELFEKVTQARARAVAASSVKEQEEAENALTRSLRRLFGVAENYPELKANQNFLQLQEELSETESKIAYARQFYNDAVMAFNTAQQVFPSNIVASLFNFLPFEYFEAEEKSREPVEVKLG
jgi:LemA protein